MERGELSFDENKDTYKIADRHFIDNVYPLLRDLIEGYEEYASVIPEVKRLLAKDLYKALNYTVDDFYTYLQREYLANSGLEDGQFLSLNILGIFSKMVNGNFDHEPEGIFQRVVTSIGHGSSDDQLKITLGNFFKKRIIGSLEESYLDLYEQSRIEEWGAQDVTTSTLPSLSPSPSSSASRSTSSVDEGRNPD